MFDFDYSYHLDSILDQEEDLPMHCPTCWGEGKLVDFWGPVRCASCEGTGLILTSVWLAYVSTYPHHIQQHLLRHQPPVWSKPKRRCS